MHAIDSGWPIARDPIDDGNGVGLCGYLLKAKTRVTSLFRVRTLKQKWKRIEIQEPGIYRSYDPVGESWMLTEITNPEAMMWGVPPGETVVVGYIWGDHVYHENSTPKGWGCSTDTVPVSFAVRGTGVLAIKVIKVEKLSRCVIM